MDIWQLGGKGWHPLTFTDRSTLVYTQIQASTWICIYSFYYTQTESPFVKLICQCCCAAMSLWTSQMALHVHSPLVKLLLSRLLQNTHTFTRLNLTTQHKHHHLNRSIRLPKLNCARVDKRLSWKLGGCLENGNKTTRGKTVQATRGHERVFWESKSVDLSFLFHLWSTEAFNTVHSLLGL